VKESPAQDTMLDRLRGKYAVKLLTSENNKLKNKILDQAYEYHKLDEKERKANMFKAANDIKERLKMVT